MSLLEVPVNKTMPLQQRRISELDMKASEQTDIGTTMSSLQHS